MNSFDSINNTDAICDSGIVFYTILYPLSKWSLFICVIFIIIILKSWQCDNFQGTIKLPFPRLHNDCPVIIYVLWAAANHVVGVFPRILRFRLRKLKLIQSWLFNAKHLILFFVIISFSIFPFALIHYLLIYLKELLLGV